MDTPLELVAVSPRVRRAVPRWIVVLGTIVALVVGLLWWIGVIGGNVRTVAAGRFYRSAQLSGANLEEVLREYGIKSVVNLRGPSPRGYYRSEVAVCKEMGVAHYDVSLSAYHLPKPSDLRTLLGELDRAPRPTLIHCQQGADRSGLVSTIYANVYEGVPLDRAEREQLTWRYGHFGFVGTWRMERFFDLYRESCRGESLRSWITTTYPSVYARATRS